MSGTFPGEGASLTLSLVRNCGSAASFCITRNALVQGLSNESGEKFRGSLMDYDTSSAASHVTVPQMWPSQGGVGGVGGG